MQPQDKYVLRMPDGMRDKLKSEADVNGRSMNAEIVARLDESLNARSDLQTATVELRETIGSLRAWKELLSGVVEDIIKEGQTLSDGNLQLLKSIVGQKDQAKNG